MTCLQHAFLIDNNGQATELPTTPIPLAPKPGEGFLWLHFDRKHPDTRTVFIEDKMVDNVATNTLLAADSRPRTIVRNEDVLINLRGVNLNAGAEPEDMIPIRFFIQSNRVISVCGRKLKATQDRVERLKTQSVSSTPGGFIAGYALALADRMAPTITDLNEQVDTLEEAIDENRSELARSKVTEIRREAIMLRRYLAPQREALNTLAMQSLPWISNDDQLRLRDSADQATRITEELDAVRERCAIVKDQLSDMRAEEMNRNMMLLSVVAAIFLPLGLISGMMGINVGGMPWVENAMGFWYVTAIVVIIGLVQLLIFRLVKWL
ncbi:zinc transporter [Litorimonas taeanensis]|uniref:Zinc transporter n=1 Tax=Litorimonas taeanensis TaxID=568099 RepID=A0A420WMG1_9PROT|nr:zinc transporter ZntB [Litorimonas taeanensis]RKQ72102.1 zinc transporter [Litorimonas taeanensis]